MKYTEEMLIGHEIVVVGSERFSGDSSSIFWKDRDGQTYVFSRHLGIMKHSATDDDLNRHFKSLKQDGYTILVRGSKY